MSAKSFSDQLGELIYKAEAELDELRLKIALGKMTGADIFEDIKKELHTSFRELISELKNDSSGSGESIRKQLTGLQSLLEQEKAEVLEAYEEQKEKISAVILELEKQLHETGSGIGKDFRIKLLNELEKYRLKIEILQIRYELGKLDLKENIESRKTKFRKEFDELLTNIRDDTSTNMEAYGTRLKNAYDSLRKSLQT